jgi:membrane protein implicated in regulation of membrane protease activity
MNLREAIGLALIIAALVLVPVAWAFSRLLWALAFFLLIIGVTLFYTERVKKREEKLQKETGGVQSHNAILPADIHDYTGWGSGGRSQTMDNSSFDSGGGDGD